MCSESAAERQRGDPGDEYWGSFCFLTDSSPFPFYNLWKLQNPKQSDFKNERAFGVDNVFPLQNKVVLRCCSKES